MLRPRVSVLIAPIAALAVAVLALPAAAQVVRPPHSYRCYQPLPQYCPPTNEHVAPRDAPLSPPGTLRGDLQRRQAEDRSPGDNPPPQDIASSAPPSAPSPAASTVASSPSSAAPAMIGDHFGNGYRFSGGGDLPVAGGLRRVKIAENVSPMPQDRVFFNFNNFYNTVRPSNDLNNQIDLFRYTIGVEKTFFENIVSLEIRAPITDGLNADQRLAPGADNEGGEFGNMTITPKVLLAGDCCYRLSAGMGIQLPTADDARLFDAGGVLRTEVENNAVHLQPFLGLLLTPNSRLFAIAYAQFDADLSGFDVTGVAGTGEFRDPLFLYLDAQVGYWVYQNCCCSSLLTGIAPVAEIHYATNLDDFEPAPGIEIDAPRVDIVNMTAGVKLQFGPMSTLTVSGAFPLTNEDNRQFDSELIVQFTQRF